MNINKFEPFHGVVLHRLINADEKLELIIKPGFSYHSYLVNESKFSGREDKTIGLFIKHASKPRSPWRYTMLKNDQDELKALQTLCDSVFLLLVCGMNGVACLNYSHIKEILDSEYEDQEWISVSTRLHAEYQIKGNDGNLMRKIPRNFFPNAVISLIKKISSKE